MKLSEFKHEQRLRSKRTGMAAIVIDINDKGVGVYWETSVRSWLYDVELLDDMEEYSECPFVRGDLIEGLVTHHSWQTGKSQHWEPLRMVAWHPDGRITIHILSGSYAGNDTVAKYNSKWFRKKQS